MIAIRRNICRIEAVVPKSKTVKVHHSRIDTAHASIDIERTEDMLMTVPKDDIRLSKCTTGKLIVIDGITVEPNNSRVRILIKKL